MQGARANRWKRIILDILPLLIIGLGIVVDQITKKHFQNLEGTVTVIKDFFYFSLVYNDGAAWSFLSGVSWAQTFFKVLTVLALVVFVVFLIYAYKNKYSWLKIALSLVIAGTVGNFIDRICIGSVVDFLSFYFFGWGFPIFNVADILLVIGTIMLIIHMLFIDKWAIFKKNEETKSNQ